MFLHELFLRALTYLPPMRSRLEIQIGHFAPILEPAFQENRYAQLLTLFCLDSIDCGRLRAAQKLLNRLEPIAFAGSDAEKALWCVLAGYYLDHCDQRGSAVSAYEEASGHGHQFPLPHLVTAEFHLLNTKLYDLALENYNKAINILYHNLPLNEEKQHLIAMAQAGLSITLAMMHRTDDATAALAKADLASDSEEYLHATALLSAINGDQEGAEEALAAFRKISPQLAEHVAGHVRMILDRTHIHFFPRPVNPGLPEAFWTWFRSKEKEFQSLLDKGDADACGTMLAEHINTLVPDEEDQMYSAVELHDGKPEMILTACYSRSYAAMMEALAAACPEDICRRWIITLRP